MSTTSKILLPLSLVSILIVAVSHGGINGYTIWNSLPIPIALLPLLIDRSQREIKYAVIGFSTTIILIIAGFHAGYFLRESVFADPASIPGEKLIGLPLYSVGAGYISGMIGVAAGVVQGIRLQKREGHSSSELPPD